MNFLECLNIVINVIGIVKFSRKVSRIEVRSVFLFFVRVESR